MHEISKSLGRPFATICKSSKQIGELVKEAKSISGKKAFVLLLDENTDPERLLASYFNAMVKEQGNIAKAQSPCIEMLLFVCGTSNIKEAIKRCGAKKSERFLVFSTSKSLFDKFVKNAKASIVKQVRLVLQMDKAANVAMTEA